MSKYITEMLEDINANPTEIVKYKDSTVLKTIFEYAFDPEKKFALPDGIPPFKEDSAPLGMSPGNLLMEIKRLYIFCRTDLNHLRKETLFIQLLESVHPSEARLVLAIKDQTLHLMYKKITHQLVYNAEMVSVAPIEKAKKIKKSQQPTGTDS